MRRRLPPFLTTKKGLLGACLTFYVAVRLTLDVLQDIEYAISHAGSIAGFLASTGGNAVMLVGGIFLLIWAALSGPPGVVAHLENKGPVLTEEWAPDDVELSDTEVACVVPYKHYDTASTYFSDPATTIKVEDAGDDILISVSYKVQGEGWAHPTEGAWGVQMDTGVQVLDEEGKPVRILLIEGGWVEIQEDGSWQHEVAGSRHLLGLPEGVYGLNILDVTDVLLDLKGTDTEAYPALKGVATDTPIDLRSDTRRKYRDMRLTARRL